MYQKIIIAGNLGSDPELRYLTDGTPVANFSVATNRKWGSGDDAKEEVTWFRVSVFRGQAEACNTYLSKGRQVIVEGRLHPDEQGNPRTFTRGDGTVGASYEITAESVRFLGGASEPASAASGKPASRSNPNREQEEVPF